MSIYYSGSFRRSGGVASAIAKQLKGVNLKAVQRITITFDPFAENVISTREVLHHLASTKIAATNPKCLLKADVVCDRRPAEIKFSFIPEIQEKIKFKEVKLLCDNLTTLEVLQLCNKHISALAPKEELTEVPQTKSAKKAQGGGASKVGKKK